jgi:error-prone DNA polymerase
MGMSRREFAEVCCTSNFSFLTGGSHPEEYVAQGKELKYHSIGICDHHSLAGIVRAWREAKKRQIPLLIGTQISIFSNSSPSFTTSESLLLAVYPRSKEGYHTLSNLLTYTDIKIPLTVFSPLSSHFEIVILPPLLQSLPPSFESQVEHLVENITYRYSLYLASSRLYLPYQSDNEARLSRLARRLSIPLIATNRPLFHISSRKPLHDVITCIREKTTLERAGFLLQQNSEQFLRSREMLSYLYADIPSALIATLTLSERVKDFNLDQINYRYPLPLDEHGMPMSDIVSYLRRLVFQGAAWRYPEGIPPFLTTLLNEELALIHELDYERYFLTCYEIVLWARQRGILCQGRGAAANSAVCFCLGITSVDPSTIDLLFGRFISKERDEPPDIDIDFEHERREEVIQFIYQRYGRSHTALTASVVTYRHRSAFREVAKVFALAPPLIDSITKSLHRWTQCTLTNAHWESVGLSGENPVIQKTIRLAQELKGFPRHLSQHVGGFIISETPLSEIVPIVPSAMESRTTVEWDKDDIEFQGMMKIDILALGMLTCIRKALTSINDERLGKNLSSLCLATIPQDDEHTYDMLCRGDSLGLFQVESRAQMSMLPRLKPRCFYDLVIQVAIVRPGPIQGDMVHPFLRRRSGKETFSFPDTKVRVILEKTLGVPLFQEQAMRLAIVLADFTPGEAEQLRRAMSAWKHNEDVIARFKERIIKGMVDNGYSPIFAETCMTQIRGFSEYGFPESHAASFALLVYASAWIKCHYPAHFAAALLNSQPMGFYAPSQIIADAQRHSVKILPIDINESWWMSFSDQRKNISLRLGMSLVKQVRKDAVLLIDEEKKATGAYTSIESLWHRLLTRREQYKENGVVPVPSLRDLTTTLVALARADAYQSLSLSTKEALWEIRALKSASIPLPLITKSRYSSRDMLQSIPPLSAQELLWRDYQATHFSLRGHFFTHRRETLTKQNIVAANILSTLPHGAKVRSVGLSLIRQRPGTSKGVVFITLEDETGLSNLIIFPSIFQKFSSVILTSSFLFVQGIIEKNKDNVVYIKVDFLEGIDEWIIPSHSRPNVPLSVKSYSY